MHYAAFRTWVISKIVEGASPARCAKYLSRYRERYLATAGASWCDGLPEVPSEAEVAALREKGEWAGRP